MVSGKTSSGSKTSKCYFKLTEAAGKILYLSYDGMTDPLGQSQVIPYLKELHRSGYKIHIVSFEKQNRKKNADEIRKQLKTAGIFWHPLTYHKKPPILSTLLDIYLLNNYVVNLHKKEIFDIVHCRSYITAFTGLRMKKQFGTKFLFDMRGFFADERVDGNIWELNNPIYKAIYKYFKNKEREFLTDADYIITLTNKAKAIIGKREDLIGQPLPIQVIPCCADLELFSDRNLDLERRSYFKSKLGVSANDFIIMYTGSIGTWYMLDEMLDFFKVLLHRQPNAKFCFVTTDLPNEIYSKAKQKEIGTESIRVTDAKRDEMPYYLSLTDVAIFFIKPVFSKQASSPTKQGELMGMGIPVICNAGIGDTDMVIEQYNSGVLVNEFTVAEYERIIDLLPSIQQLNKDKIVAGAREFYSLKQGVERYAKVYECLLKE